MAGENLVRPKGFKEWIENFWYHYKFYTIVAIFVVITLVVSIAQCATKTQYDYKVILATTTATVSQAQIDSLQKELAKYGTDVNGDGVVNVQVVDCTINQYKMMGEEARAKRSKLQSLLMNDVEAMMIISDGDCFEWITETLGGDFIKNTGLPHKNGMAFDIDNTPLLNRVIADVDARNEKSNVLVDVIWPEGLNISRRSVEGTLFEGREGAIEAAENADKFIQNLISQNSVKNSK